MQRKLLEAGKSAAVDARKGLVERALIQISRKILQKYTDTPETQNINSLIDGSTLAIQDLVKNCTVGLALKCTIEKRK